MGWGLLEYFCRGLDYVVLVELSPVDLFSRPQLICSSSLPERACWLAVRRKTRVAVNLEKFFGHSDGVGGV